MAMITKDFPVDISAVKKYGVSQWQKEFFWPVSDEAYISLCQDIEAYFAQQINIQPEVVSDLLLIQHKLRSEYCYFLQALAVLAKIKAQGLRALYSDNTLWYKDILEGNFFAVSQKTAKNIQYSQPSEDSFLRKIKLEVKRWLGNFSYNFSLFKLINSIVKRKVFIVCGSIDSIIKEYIKNLPYLTYITYQQDWLSGRQDYKVPPTLEDEINEVSRVMIQGLNAVAKKHQINIDDLHLDYLKQLTKDSLLDAAKLYNLVKDKVGNRRIDLLISSLANPIHRAICISVRKNGGRVISFSHGGLIGLYDTPTFAFSEFALSDEFITYTPVSIALFDKIKANHSPLKNNQFIINSIDTQVYFKLWRKHKNKALPLKIKKVMLLGFPLNQIRNYTMAGGFSLMRLDLELRIIESLEKSGYRVIYKVHPDRRQEAKGLFQGFNNVEIWEGYFEDCLDQVDAFIFSHLRTTAFSSALCTNKPIISLRLEPEFFKPLPEAQELLAKRCDFINAQFDERNRIIFNEKEFLACLAKRPEFPNNDFLKKYMFPSTYSYYG